MICSLLMICKKCIKLQIFNIQDKSQIMKAMVLTELKKPLVFQEVEIPVPLENQILIRIEACGVCRTDLHIVEGELPSPKLPLIPGHQIVGIVEKKGEKVKKFSLGERVGVPWLGGTCGHCEFCLKGKENLCDNALFTGYTLPGGFAEYGVANANYCFSIPNNYSPTHAAPLLCGGLIGYRAYRMVSNAHKIGFYGFGSSAHILVQIAVAQKKEIYAFTKEGDLAGQTFAKQLGAVWAGSSKETLPIKLDAAILFAPVGKLVPLALKSIVKGGTVVCAGIHMSDLPSFPYSLLWEERILRSVANLTRQDGKEFFELATTIPLHTNISTYPLEKANQALDDLHFGKIKGSAVLSL